MGAQVHDEVGPVGEHLLAESAPENGSVQEFAQDPALTLQKIQVLK